VDELERRAMINERDARHDSVRFWALTLPAIASSAAAGLLAVADLDTAAAVLAAIASACGLVDAVNPRGQLRNAHLRAVHDLRKLEHRVANEWRVGVLRGDNRDALAATILETAQRARDDVGDALRAAETSFAATVERP
jgi:hypothetical protein